VTAADADRLLPETVLLTGFPGFLGSRLLPRILRRSPGARAACLVQPRFEALAKERAAALQAADPALAGRIDLVAGDLTSPGLGIDGGDRLAAGVTEIWHLAAVYDLSVAREVGMRVNVEGTRNMLRFAEGCPGLRRHHYVSTCYVSGRHCGPFREDDLDVGQAFNNFYEETKFLAEVEVAEARTGGMPTTVYRPAIVVGDSRTGDTQKFDGPYFLLQWLVRQPRWAALVPYVGDPTMVRFNMVPSDFVIDAVDHLSGLGGSAGRTYQLADPRPLTVDALLTEMCRATGRRGVRVRLPHRLTTWTLAHVGPVERIVGIPASAVEYFVHPTHYDTTAATRDLAGSGVACPPVADYLPRLVRFMTEHRDANLGVMV
jgi:thioester reductase-like protein